MCGYSLIFISTTNNFRERSSITSAHFGGLGGLRKNVDAADGLEGGWGV